MISNFSVITTSKDVVPFFDNVAFFGNEDLLNYNLALWDADDLQWNEVQVNHSSERNQVTEKISQETTSHLSNYQNQSVTIVIDELISNSFNHSNKSQPVVKLGWVFDPKTKNIVIRISDNGGQFSLKQILFLFDHSDLPQSPKSDSKGAGLGLYFCKEFSSEMFFRINQNDQSQITCIIPYRPRKNKPLLMVSFENAT